MLRILGRASQTCDGVPRRELLRVGALSLFSGLTMPRLLQARKQQNSGARPATARGRLRSGKRRVGSGCAYGLPRIPEGWNPHVSGLEPERGSLLRVPVSGHLLRWLVGFDCNLALLVGRLRLDDLVGCFTRPLSRRRWRCPGARTCARRTACSRHVDCALPMRRPGRPSTGRVARTPSVAGRPYGSPRH